MMRQSVICHNLKKYIVMKSNFDMGKDEMDEFRVVWVSRQDVIDSIIAWVCDAQIVLDQPDKDIFSCMVYRGNLMCFTINFLVLTVLWVLLILHGEYKSWLLKVTASWERHNQVLHRKWEGGIV